MNWTEIILLVVGILAGAGLIVFLSQKRSSAKAGQDIEKKYQEVKKKLDSGLQEAEADLKKRKEKLKKELVQDAKKLSKNPDSLAAMFRKRRGGSGKK